MVNFPIRRGLISVSDKAGLVDFARGLLSFEVRILSTGGTATFLRAEDVAVIEVSHYTDFPEIMGGRVKTLHPLVHGGILADREDHKHALAMETNNISAIDLVVVSLYPFLRAVESGKSYDECIEEIDIGGITLIRAAAKNHRYVTVITDPDDYAEVLRDMKDNHGATSPDLRRYLAEQAFVRSANYDANISRWFASNNADTPLFAKRFFLTGKRAQSLRYGENSQQQAAFYGSQDTPQGMAAAEQVQGKELSYNNISDAAAAFRLASEFSNEKSACVIVKHANPCGVALAKSACEAYLKARSCDPESAFGGIVALNTSVSVELAEALLSSKSGLFLEVLIAPSADADAIKLLQKKPQLRILLTGSLWERSGDLDFDVSSVPGGFLVQEVDDAVVGSSGQCEVVTKKKPTKKQWDDMLFAWKVVKYTNSNAIVFARDLVTVGICGGQTSRVAAAKFAIIKAEDGLGVEGSVVASDAFLPFADTLVCAKDAGAVALMQTGGSINDEDVIKVADECGMSMVMTGMRHFKH